MTRDKIETWLKVLGFVLTLGTLIWKAGAVQEQLTQNYNFLSYQLGEFSKQLATDTGALKADTSELRRRTEFIEQRFMQSPPATQVQVRK